MEDVMDSALKGLRLIGYCRVSTDNQKEDGTIEIQENALREYARKEEIDLVHICMDEGVSGGLENRPGLALLVDYLHTDETIAGILIFKLDRLARDVRIQENLIYDIQSRKGRRIISVQEPDLDSKDPARILLRQILGSFSQYEKSQIAMRLSLGRLNKARKGGYAGGSKPTGYKVEGKDLLIDHLKAETIKTIFRMRAENMGLREIARKLNEDNYPTSRGGLWHAGTVRYILNNAIYHGTLDYMGERVRRQELSIIG
jgi:site-specific DNA recombinase